MPNHNKLESALQSPYVRAFLGALRWCEGTDGPNGYRTLFGGSTFDSFDDHPRRPITARLGARTITSTAAGAFQFLSKTWDGLVRQYGFSDFSPKNQDLGAVALIDGRRALDSLLAGDFESTIKLCAREWASLPGSPYGQPVKTMAATLAKIYENLRRIDPDYDEPSKPVKEPVQPKEKTMSPFIMPAIEVLSSVIPAVGKLFAKSDNSKRNVEAASVIVTAAKQAVGARNEQELIEMVKTGDPEVVKAVTDGVKEVWHEVTSNFEGVEAAAARNADAKAAPFWLNPGFYITLALLPLVYFVVVYTLMNQFPSDVKSMVIAAVVSGVLNGILGYWLGTSFSSSRKTEMMSKPGQP